MQIILTTKGKYNENSFETSRRKSLSRQNRSNQRTSNAAHSPLAVAKEDVEALIDGEVDFLVVTARKDLSVGQMKECMQLLKYGGIEAVDVAHELRVKINSELANFVFQL